MFCRIAAGDEPARVVWESDDALAFFPDVPATRGHTLVIPRSHVEDFVAASPAVLSAVALASNRVGRALERALEPQGMNAITSKGRAASQSVFHLHVHLVPRWDGDRMGDLWPPDQPTQAEALDALASSLRSAFSSG